MGDNAGGEGGRGAPVVGQGLGSPLFVPLTPDINTNTVPHPVIVRVELSPVLTLIPHPGPVSLLPIQGPVEPGPRAVDWVVWWLTAQYGSRAVWPGETLSHWSVVLPLPLNTDHVQVAQGGRGLRPLYESAGLAAVPHLVVEGDVPVPADQLQVEVRAGGLVAAQLVMRMAAVVAATESRSEIWRFDIVAKCVKWGRPLGGPTPTTMRGTFAARQLTIRQLQP